MKIFNVGVYLERILAASMSLTSFICYSVNTFQHGRESLRSVCAGLCESICPSACVYVCVYMSQCGSPCTRAAPGNYI